MTQSTEPQDGALGGRRPTMQSSRFRDAQSVWLIICMAVATAALRLSIVLANALVLWRVYGRARVLREHLQITSSKPELVVSNGDVLRALTFQHYVTGVAIWLVISVLVITMLHRRVLPPGLQRMLKHAKANSPGSLGTLWALGLFLLVGAVLPLPAALTLALVSLVVALSWARRIRVEN